MKMDSKKQDRQTLKETIMLRYQLIETPCGKVYEEIIPRGCVTVDDDGNIIEATFTEKELEDREYVSLVIANIEKNIQRKQND